MKKILEFFYLKFFFFFFFLEGKFSIYLNRRVFVMQDVIYFYNKKRYIWAASCA